MEGMVQQAIAHLSGMAGSPVKERPVKKVQSAEIPEGQVALAEYLKKELGEMIDDKVNANIKRVDEKIDVVARATDKGLKNFQDQLDAEKADRANWQQQMEKRFAGGTSSRENDPMIQEKIKGLEEDIAKIKVSHN